MWYLHIEVVKTLDIEGYQKLPEFGGGFAIANESFKHKDSVERFDDFRRRKSRRNDDLGANFME